MEIVFWFLELAGKFLPILIVIIVVIQGIVQMIVLRHSLDNKEQTVVVGVQIIWWLEYSSVKTQKLMW